MSTSIKKTEYDKLSAKRQRFVDEYCVDFNGTQAAIEPKTGENISLEAIEDVLIAAENLTEKRVKNDNSTFTRRLLGENERD